MSRIKTTTNKTTRKRRTRYNSIEILTKLVEDLRSIMGVDPVYLIDVKISDPIKEIKTSKTEEEKQELEELKDCPAWIEGLDKTNYHPMVTICFNKIHLEDHKYDEMFVLDSVVHELAHIVVWDSLIMANPNYEYEGLQARAAEVLVMKITAAIMAMYAKIKANKASV